MLIRERERATREEGGKNHPISEHCTSRGLPEVVGEEEGETEGEKKGKKAGAGNGGAREDRHGFG